MQVFLCHKHVSNEVDFYNRNLWKYFDEQITIKSVFVMETVSRKVNSCLTRILSEVDQ